MRDCPPRLPMTVNCTSRFDHAEYSAFLDGFARSPGTALGYHYPFYLRFLSEAAYPGSRVRLVTARDDSGRLIGALPGLHVASGPLNLWMSLAYFGPNSGALVPTGDANVVRGLVAGACDDARGLVCDSMTIYTPLNANADVYRRALGGVDFGLGRVSQWMALPADPEASPWPRKVRYDVRYARERGVSARTAMTRADIDAIWKIYEAYNLTKGIPIKPRAHIQFLFEHAGEHGCFLVAERNGEIVGGLVCFFGGGVMSYYLPCATPEARRLQTGLLLLDEGVRRARKAGCRVLNFEGSPGGSEANPVYRFKARCGGEPVPYHVLIKLMTAGALDKYRALGPEAIAREVPHAFVAPYDALVGATLERS